MFRFAIDRGGTFTDIWAHCPSGKTKVVKLLSEDPLNYPDAPREGIRRILQEETGLPFPQNKPIDVSAIEWIRMGTTVATNALLERKGSRMALAISKGFKDLFHIGNQARPSIFDLEIFTPEQLYEEVIEVEGRLVLQQDNCEIQQTCQIVEGKTKEKLEVWEELNEDQLETDLKHLHMKGISSLAVVLMHSYMFDDQEQIVEEIARRVGFTHVSLSSQVMPMVRIVPRGYTAIADAYLTPCIKNYVEGFASGFEGGLQNVRVLFMQSDGGLTPVESFIGSRAILSGPAGGVVGYALTTFHKETQVPVIGFDMGGTSTDVSRYAGQYEHVFESTTAGITIQAPQLDINTVAAGGGSMLLFRSGMFVVGPESAGANPGPTCYKKGGPLTVTDANLLLKRIIPQYFPKIFGKTQDQPLDEDASKRKFNQLTKEINDFLKDQSKNSKKTPMTIEEVAMGFIKVANETMCRPIRAVTQAKGHDTAKHILACFGGAGGQHACSIARSLGMTEVYVHRYAGILSAYGLALADVVHECQEPCAMIYNQENFEYLDQRIKALTDKCRVELLRQGFKEDSIETEAYLHMRYERTDCALMCSTENYPAEIGTSQYGDFQQSFQYRYHTEFGFVLPDRPIIIDDVRIRGVAKAFPQNELDVEEAIGSPRVEMESVCYFEAGWLSTNVYMLEDLKAGHEIKGPAIIINGNSTILVEPTCQATITKTGDIRIMIGSGIVEEVGQELDMIQLSIFSHRFMSIAEQMGRLTREENSWQHGRRVVEIDHIAKQMSCTDCGSQLVLQNIVREVRYGLGSVFMVECICGIVNNISSGKTHRVGKTGPPVFDVNTKAAIGMMHSGIAHRQMTGFLASLEIEGLHYTTAKKREKEVELHIQSVAKESCKEALANEINLQQEAVRVLQRTSISTNIKERLDFSCAMFGPDGGLVANAPHIPVHLGAMQETVQYQISSLGDDLRPGDVILSNHPKAGGSHLPDLTVITPVFSEDKSVPVFFVASRGHHADIGGITPGSMPPHSKYLHEEGAVFKSFKLVTDGAFQEEAVTCALNDPAKHPGSSGTRNLGDNLSDLRAQVAANQKGIHLLLGLIQEYGLQVVQAYMDHIQANSELAVKDMLKVIAEKTINNTGTTCLMAEDFMDNGAKITLKVEIDAKQGTAICDFSGSSFEVFGNLNAPRAVTLSALIYCLRCMVGHDVPLNQGCLKPVQVIIPAGSILDPSENAAVVGGNVLTSQRIVDVILKAFGTCAASQGCMNNITFGDDNFGHYETVAGGAGAGPTWHGRSGVHSHMTNTRITDPEILERRYPVILKRFHLKPGTGGEGQYHGGDGVIREYLWRKSLTLSVLTERRVFSPYGLNGGEDGQKGQNLMIYKDGRIVNLGGKISVDCKAGDMFLLQTPGGGGYGHKEYSGPVSKQRKMHSLTKVGTGSLFEYKRTQESV